MQSESLLFSHKMRIFAVIFEYRTITLMNMQTPKLMTLLRMRDILDEHVDELRRHVYYIDDHLAIIHSSTNLFQFFIRQQPPFTFDDRRLGVVVKGEATVNINLVDKTLKAGTIAFIGPGSIVNPVRFSPDFEICGFGIPTDFPLPGPLPQAMNGQVRDFQLDASEAERLTVTHILDTLWHVVQQKDYSMSVVSSLVYAQMHHYDSLFRQYQARQQNTRTRNQTTFDRFIQLVNQHAQKEHHIAFYAEKMCLTEHYLGTVVRQASGMTAKEWIDRAIVTHVKVMLRHTQKTMVQISEEMNFPNPSFFNRYFKRLTGMPPAEFRK